MNRTKHDRQSLIAALGAATEVVSAGPPDDTANLTNLLLDNLEFFEAAERHGWTSKRMTAVLAEHGITISEGHLRGIAAKARKQIVKRNRLQGSDREVGQADEPSIDAPVREFRATERAASPSKQAEPAAGRTPHQEARAPSVANAGFAKPNKFDAEPSAGLFESVARPPL